MSKTDTSLCNVLMAAFSKDAAEAPDWVHLVPATNGVVVTNDRRGPYFLHDPQAIIRASFADTDRLPIDQDHAIDLAVRQGNPAPARGWIVEMQSRDDGIWGRVEWTKAGSALIEGREYRGISPVLLNDSKTKNIRAVPRASLVNAPNIKGQVTLHSKENNVDDINDEMDKVSSALGLKSGSSVEEIIAAIKGMADNKKDKPELHTALQAELGASKDAVIALQSEVADLTKTLNAQAEVAKKSKAEAFVNQALSDKRAGINAGTREYFITLHMQDPENTEAMIGKMPTLGASNMSDQPPSSEAETSLNAEQTAVADMLGISHDTFKEQLQFEQKGTSK